MFKNDDDVNTNTTQDNFYEAEQSRKSPLAPVLPLTDGSGEQYAMIREYKDLAIQNFKMLLLTSPGERVMDSNFGVGLRQYLFELPNRETKKRIAEKIEDQSREYTPYIDIKSITFPSSQDDTILSVNIKFTITSINEDGEITITQSII